METTPDKHCKWQVHLEYLEDSLNQIHKHGSTVIAVVPYELTPPEQAPFAKITVDSYLIIYYNPPVSAIPGLDGSGHPSTVQ